GPLAWRAFSLHALLGEAAQRLARQQPGRPPSAEDEQFFAQLVAIARSANVTLRDPAAYRSPCAAMAGGRAPRPAPASPPPTGARPTEGLLARPQSFFSGDGALAFLRVRPAGQKDEMVGPRASVEALRALVAGLRTSYHDLEIGLTGLPVLETDEMLASQRDTNLASWLALAGVALLYLVVFRSL